MCRGVLGLIETTRNRLCLRLRGAPLGVPYAVPVDHFNNGCKVDGANAMLVRVLAVVVTLGWTGTLSAECADVPAESAATLEAKLERTQAELTSTPTAQRGSATYRLMQERALLELERLQCKREASAPQEAVTRGPGVETQFATIPVLLITDRARVVPPPNGGAFFGSDRALRGLTFGRVAVRMPAENYEPGTPVPRGIVVASQIGSLDGITVSVPELLSQDAFDSAIGAYKKSLPVG